VKSGKGEKSVSQKAFFAEELGCDGKRDCISDLKLVTESLFNENGDSIFFNVFLCPGAPRDEVIGLYFCQNRLPYIRIAVTGLPHSNQANKCLVLFLSKKLKLAKSNVSIASGEKSRRKRVRVVNCGLKKVLESMGVEIFRDSSEF
jgi:uncharacterized protein (TIGR00251 family)